MWVVKRKWVGGYTCYIQYRGNRSLLIGGHTNTAQCKNPHMATKFAEEHEAKQVYGNSPHYSDRAVRYRGKA